MKLTPTQRALLSRATQRDDRSLELPSDLKGGFARDPEFPDQNLIAREGVAWAEFMLQPPQQELADLKIFGKRA